MAYLAKLDARYVFTFGWGQIVVVVVVGGGGGWLLVAWLLGWFVCSLVRLFVCSFVLLLLLLLLSLSSSSLLLLFLLLFSHENKLMDFIFFLNPLPVRLNVLRYQKSLAKRTIR